MNKLGFYFLCITVTVYGQTVNERDNQHVPQKNQSQKKSSKKSESTTTAQKVAEQQLPTNATQDKSKNNTKTVTKPAEKHNNNSTPVVAGAPTTKEIPAGTPQPAPTAPQLQLIDAIVIIIFSDEGAEIITRIDIDRPSLSGVARTVDDIIFERLVYLDAKKHKILPDEDSVDRYLNAIQHEHNLKPEELQMIFLQAGYTLEEGREQLKMMQAVNSMLDYKIRSNLIVPRKHVEEYYNEHPEFQEASYLISYTKIPFDSAQSKDVQRAELEEKSKTGDFVGVLWEGPFWIVESDLAQDKQFITKLAPGQIAAPYQVADGFELYRLEDKKERYQRTIEERYREIVEILRKPKYEELLDNYRKSLFARARIEHVQ